MATPSRKDEMIKNLMRQHRKKTEKKLTDDGKPKDPEAVKELVKLWKESRRKNDKPKSI